MFKAWAQLVRLPNVFTAPADVMAGVFLLLRGWRQPFDHDITMNILIVLGSSICFYMAGMILNDVFDSVEDLRDRPQRPIPSGRINRNVAMLAGFILLGIGLFLGLWRWYPSLDWPYNFPALSLPVLILGYNLGLKRTAIGPLVMGLCRGMNLLLGASILPVLDPIALWAACTVTLYIAGVTMIATDEVRPAERLKFYQGVSLLALAFISLATMMIYFNVFRFPDRWIPMLIVYLLHLGLVYRVLLAAIRQPSPATIQQAIKYCIMGLILMETAHSCFSIGWSGWYLLLLLIPALYLGRFIYST